MIYTARPMIVSATACKPKRPMGFLVPLPEALTAAAISVERLAKKVHSVRCCWQMVWRSNSRPIPMAASHAARVLVSE